MSRVRRMRALLLLGMLSLALVVLAGCSGSDGDGGSSAPRSSRVILQLASTDHVTSDGLSRATLPGQPRQESGDPGFITGIDVSARAGQVTTTESFTLQADEQTEIRRTLAIPQGDNVEITVRAFNEDGANIFSGVRSSVNLTETGEDCSVTAEGLLCEVLITLVRDQLILLPTELADLENRLFAFDRADDDVAFGIDAALGVVTLTFGTLMADTLPFILAADDFTASGNAMPTTAVSAALLTTRQDEGLVTPFDLVVSSSNFPAGQGPLAGQTLLLVSQTDAVDGRIQVRSSDTDATATSAPPASASSTLATTVVGIVTDQDNVAIAGASVTTNGGLTGITASDGSFSIPNVPTNLGDIAIGAAFTTPDGTSTGSSPSVTAVPGGVTDVGTIVLSLVQVNEEAVVLTSDPFQIPAGFDTLTFDFNFLSNEFPDFVGSEFNDTSFALVRNNGNTIETQVLTNVNTANFLPADGSGFNGQTGFLTATFDVAALAGSGTQVQLEISVRDVGDSSIDSAILIDTISLVDNDTGDIQSILNGNFEAGDFSAFVVSFTDVVDATIGPIAGVITGLGPVDSVTGSLSTTVVGPAEGSFMALLATGTDALNFIASPPSVIVTGATSLAVAVVDNGDGTVTVAGATGAVPPGSAVTLTNVMSGATSSIAAAPTNGSFTSTPIAAVLGDRIVIAVAGEPVQTTVTVGDTFLFILDASRLDDLSQPIQ